MPRGWVAGEGVLERERAEERAQCFICAGKQGCWGKESRRGRSAHTFICGRFLIERSGDACLRRAWSSREDATEAVGGRESEPEAPTPALGTLLGRDTGGHARLRPPGCWKATNRWCGGLEESKPESESSLAVSLPAQVAGCGGGPSTTRRRPAGAAAELEDTEPSAVAEGSTVAGVEHAAEQEAGEARTLSCAVRIFMGSTSPPTESSGAGGASLTVASSAVGPDALACVVPRCVTPK